MRYERVRTILQQLTPAYHRRVRSYYEQLAETGATPRVRMMLDYLVDHEEERARALGEFCHAAPHQVLDLWLKGLEIDFPVAGAEILSPVAASDLDQLVKAAVAYKLILINYFAHLCEHSSDLRTSNLFQTLKIQEERAMKRMVRHAQGLADL
jgi:hypothetical protein